MSDDIQIPVVLGHKVSESQNYSVLKGLEREATFQKCVIVVEVPRDVRRTIVENNCEICNKTLMFKVLTTKYYLVWRAIWVTLLSIILGAILIFAYPYSKFVLVVMAIVAIIIGRLLFWRNPQPIVTWADGENRDQKHIIL